MIAPANGIYAQYNPPVGESFLRQVLVWWEKQADGYVTGLVAPPNLTLTQLWPATDLPNFTRYLGTKEAEEKGFIHKPVDHIPPR